MTSAHLTKALAKASCLARLMRNPELSVLSPTLREDAHCFLLSQVENVFVSLRNGIQQPWNDFSLDIRESSLGSDAGRGLFIKGKAIAGRVVAVYAGEVWSQEMVDAALSLMSGDLTGSRQIREEVVSGKFEPTKPISTPSLDLSRLEFDFGNNPENINEKMEQLLTQQYTYCREDGILINGWPSERLHKVIRKNPTALAYLINHPPYLSKQISPNVVGVDIKVSTELRQKLHSLEHSHGGPSSVGGFGTDDSSSANPWSEEELPFVPTWTPLLGLPTDTSGLLTVFVAMRDLNDEEVFFDYEMSHNSESSSSDQSTSESRSADLPEWYEEVPFSVYTDENEQELYRRVEGFLDDSAPGPPSS